MKPWFIYAASSHRSFLLPSKAILLVVNDMWVDKSQGDDVPSQSSGVCKDSLGVFEVIEFLNHS